MMTNVFLISAMLIPRVITQWDHTPAYVKTDTIMMMAMEWFLTASVSSRLL